VSGWRPLAVLAVSFRLCLLEILSNKTRSILSSLGVFLGTGSLLVNMVFLRGMDDDIKRNLDMMGGVTILTVRQAEPEDAEIEEIKKSVPHIDAILPQRDMHWKHIQAKGKTSGGRFTAVSKGHHETYNYAIRYGTGFSDEHFARRAKVVLIGRRAAAEVFGDEASSVGQRVSIDGRSFTVVGVLDAKDKRDWRARESHIPFPTYESTFGGRFGNMNEIPVKIDAVENIATAKQAIEAELLTMHRGVKDFEVEVNLDRINERKAAALGLKILLASIAAISLSVGSISIMNIMFGTIGDRIREIGIRKALGAQKSDLFSQFLIEAVLLSFVGGGPGIIIGSSVTFFPEGTFPFFPRLSPWDFAVAVVFVGGAGVLSGLFPALKAANMQPIDALRY
jgi:putative ABC transport system permease protein